MIAALSKIMVALQRGRTTQPALQTVECPRCGGRNSFGESQFTQIDSSGFECYRLRCNACAIRLVGVIDPYDGTLLVSEVGD
jgi:hypothetical protein